MKFVPLILFIFQCITCGNIFTRSTEGLPLENNTVVAVVSKEFIITEQKYYNNTPIMYGENNASDTYTYWDLWYYPEYYVETNKNVSLNDKKHRFPPQRPEEIKTEITKLHAELDSIYSKDKNSSIKGKEHIYDPKWLMSQLKISRLIALEDAIKANKKQMRLQSGEHLTFGETLAYYWDHLVEFL
jgi:hypothetical protein